MTWLSHVVTVAPTSEPVTLGEARNQCRVDSADFDDELNGLIAQARAAVEDFTGTKLQSQTIVLRASCFSDLANLPIAPLQSVVSIKYLDTAGVEQTLASSVYETVFVGLDAIIRLKVGQSWPAVRAVRDAVRVEAMAGYSAAPLAIKRAILLMIGRWFDDRGEGDIPERAKALLENHRKF